MSATISSSSVGNSGGQVSSMACVLPAGLSVGQKLILAASAPIPNVPAAPPGWSLVISLLGGCPTWIYERVVDGSEGPTVDLALLRSNNGGAYACYAIDGWDTGAGIEHGVHQQVGGTVSPNPPPVTPSWGAVDTLFIPVFGWRWGNNGPSVLTAYPAGYSDSPITDFCNDPRGAGIAMCSHSHNLGEDNPGAATLSVVAGTTCITLAIKSA